MRIYQIVPSLLYGDGVGNDAIALYYGIKQMGYQTEIYSDYIDERIKGIGKKLDKLTKLDYDDIIIYHKASGSDISYSLEKFNCRKILRYHNITPSKFFKPYNAEAVKSVEYGYDGVNYLKDKVDYVLAVSDYNKRDLEAMGYKCKIDVLPILIPFEDYNAPLDNAILKQYSDDGWVKILFSGRISPNKKQEDVIKTFYYYKKYINSKSMLFLVGNDTGFPSYTKKLKDYVEAIDLKDVNFIGHIKFNQILAYYHLADVFLCMSEHEGFCVPLLEAMYFNTPIIAYSSSAIPDTLGGSSIILNEKDHKVAAEFINEIVTNDVLRQDIIDNQKVRLQDFSHEKVLGIFKQYIAQFMNNR